MFKKIENLRQSSKNSDGMTIIEAVIAMAGSVALLGGAFFGTVVISQAQDASKTQYNNTADVITVKSSLLRDFKNAQSSRVSGSDNNRIDLRMNNNSCTSWKIESGKLYSNRSSTAVTAAGWKEVTDRVNIGAFSTNSSGPGFNILMDSGNRWVDEVKYKNVAVNGGVCW